MFLVVSSVGLDLVPCFLSILVASLLVFGPNSRRIPVFVTFNLGFGKSLSKGALLQIGLARDVAT